MDDFHSPSTQTWSEKIVPVNVFSLVVPVSSSVVVDSAVSVCGGGLVSGSVFGLVVCVVCCSICGLVCLRSCCGS